MATGYTYKIYEGEQVSGKDFILTCARAFGALVSMRDEPNDVEIPDEFKPSDYNIKALRESQAELARIMYLSPEEITEKINQSHLRTLEYNERRHKEITDLKARYESTMAEVNLWEPPTPDHVALKEYAIKQLLDGIDYDCRNIEQYLHVPTKPSIEEWTRNQLEAIQWSIDNNTERNQADIDRSAERTAWVRSLKESLKNLA